MLTLTRSHLEIAGAVLGVILAIFGVRIWLGEHDARLKAEATVSTNQKAISDADAKEKSLAAEMAARDQAAAAREATIMDAVKNLKTTQQIVPFVQKEIAPGAPTPITINIPKATKDDPTPDAMMVIPQADLPAIRDRLTKCDLDAIDVQTCRGDSTTKSDQLKVAGTKLSAMTNERDAYKTELAGGTFWRRTKTAAKYIAIGGAIVAGGLCASGHCK